MFINVFRSIDPYFLKNDTDWKYAIDFLYPWRCWSDGLYFGVAERMKEVANVNSQVRPRMTDLGMFSSRDTAAEPSEVLSDCVKVARFVRSEALNS